MQDHPSIQPPDDPARPAGGPFQFGIGHLLVLGFVVAAFFLLDRWQRGLGLGSTLHVDLLFFGIWVIATAPAVMLTRGKVGRAVWLSAIWSAIATTAAVALVNLRP